MRFIIILSVLLMGLKSHANDEYCLALRGNGELAPAHWGAIANLIERAGLPVKQAGGSSASITMLLTDAIASNKLVGTSAGPSQESRFRASLLIKSLEGFAHALADTREFQDFIRLYTQSREVVARSWPSTLQNFFETAARMSPEDIQKSLIENRELIVSNFKVGMEIGVISEKTQPQLFSLAERVIAGQVLSAQEVRAASFYLGELIQSVRTFGEFNALEDANLFFRNGLVDFERLAYQVGRVAEFYASGPEQPGQEAKWEEFFKSCAGRAIGLTWNELTASKPECDARLRRLIDAYYSQGAEPKFYKKNVGVTIASLPTTTVLIGEAAREAIEGIAAYHLAQSPVFGADFKLAHTEDVRFGYWGRPEDLQLIEKDISRADEKGRRFYAIGHATWAQAISLSPAEPGLAPFRPFVDDSGKTLVSAGGWSDLHPVSVLKAAGCKSVIYVTRRGGESLFGQGVAKRLLRYDRDWDLLQTTPKEKYERNWILNNIGDSTDMSSLWSRLYNVANPQSSFRVSLAAADAVLCTDWNRFDVRSGINEMIKDSYRSPFYVRNRAALPNVAFLPRLNPRDMHPDGYPIFSGCF